MTPEQILSLEPALADFVGEFSECFSRSDTASHVDHYVSGQLSDIPRKTAQAIADRAGIPPRTMQEFLSLSDWDGALMRDRVQQIVVRDHFDPQAIGIVDESGHPKKGDKTACVQSQYCGNTGKIDNCVVTVHLSYVSYDNHFRTMLDSELFLPEHTWKDPERREKAGIPDDVVYRPKYDIALEQLRRAQSNGVQFAWITADEWYADKPKFIAGLQTLGLRFVMEIPRDTRGWLFFPGNQPVPAKPVANLCLYSRPMMCQAWTRFHIKNTEKGAQVWEAKVTPFWLPLNGQVVGPIWLVYARNVLNPTEQKLFLSNAAPGTPVEVILHVAFSRWPIERCLEDEKTELGLSHFELRKYRGIVHHLFLTQVSHLFLARQAKRLRGEKYRDHYVPSPHRQPCVVGRVTAESHRSPRTSAACRGAVAAYSAGQRQSTTLSHQNTLGPTRRTQHLA